MGESTLLNKGDFSDMVEVYDAVLLDFTFHTMMLQCQTRMQNFRRAIFKDNGAAVKGKVVADCGTGSGILAMWCAQAGARKVYAIEPNDNIKIARKNIEKNNLQSKIELYHARAENVTLPEKVDVIIAEVVASMLVGDGLIPWLVAFRDKWLKKGGVMMPDFGKTMLAPICDDQFYKRGLDLYESFHVQYGLDMTEMIPEYKKSMAGKTFQKVIAPESVKAIPSTLVEWDFKTLERERSDNFCGDIDFTLAQNTIIHGFCGWFSIHFGDTEISTGPFDRRSHWSTSVFYLDEPLELKKGDTIKGSFSVCTSKERPPCIENSVQYSVNDGEIVRKFWMTGPDYGQMIHAVGLDGR